ncbi:asparaginase [Salmonella enterica subsp. enterica]|nr:asparaginase [Salmonella enterica subsp. enterica]
MVVMNDTVMDGRDVTKTNTTDVATFKAALTTGPLGYIHNGKIRLPAYARSVQNIPPTPFDVSKLTALPKSRYRL